MANPLRKAQDEPRLAMSQADLIEYGNSHARSIGRDDIEWYRDRQGSIAIRTRRTATAGGRG